MSMPPPPPGPAEPDRSAHRFPCEACGAAMRFDPGRDMLICDHCGHTTPLATATAPAGPWGVQEAIRELDFEAAIRDQLDTAEMEVSRVFPCTSCGAEVEFEPGIHAAQCPFCATPIVGDPGAHRHIKPRALVPFAISESEARAAMHKWLGRLWFAPSGLAQYARKGRRMEGIYIPYWTYDARTRSAYSGERGRIRVETRRNGKGETETVQHVDWVPVSGRVARNFDDVLVAGSDSLPAPMMQGLPPWDLSRLEPYRADYLAGLRAEVYRIGLEDGFADARRQMDAMILRDVRLDIGGDLQRVHRVRTEIGGVTFKHILLPIWVGVYRYRGEAYRILVNGQSGRVQGARPWSVWKIAVAVILGLIVAGTIGFIAAKQQGM